MRPGDPVLVGIREHDALGILVRVVEMPTPSGSTVLLAEIERPRAGRSWHFLTDLRNRDEPKPPEIPVREGFG